MGWVAPADGHGGGVDLAASDPQRLLLGLLRLQSIVLANPEPITGLRAMVDQIFESPGVTRVSVGVCSGASGGIRYLAQAGEPQAPHEQAVIAATPIAAQAIATRQVVHVVCNEGGPHTCIHAPILGADAVLGLFGIGIFGRGPVQDWREQAIWATADLMALLLLGWSGSAATGASRTGTLDGLTPRQQQVLFELVERGDGNAAIGDRLQLSALTVKIHLLAAYRKLGVRTRAEAIRAVLTEHGGWLARQRWLRGRPAGGR
jgi:DNA-binding CsgD family transcriptional regulator